MSSQVKSILSWEDKNTEERLTKNHAKKSQSPSRIPKTIHPFDDEREMNLKFSRSQYFTTGNFISGQVLPV